MKKLIIISVLLTIFSFTAFSQDTSFKADDFKQYIDCRITITMKEYTPNVDFGTTFYLKEVTDNYLICTQWRNNDDYLIYILIDQIAGFGVKKGKYNPLI